jgi:ribonuclease D
MKIKLHTNDLPNSVNFTESVAVDTEAMGLNHKRDRLCLVQLSNGNGVCHLVQIQNNISKPKNLIKLFKNKKILKIFHYARFDVGILKHSFDINIENIYCTKIASKLTRTFTDKHGYKDLCKNLLNKKISKTEQTTDWGSKKLTQAQQKYAATDVLYLHKIKNELDKMLIRENRVKLAQACFNFISIRVDLDLLGWSEQDIFKH